MSRLSLVAPCILVFTVAWTAAGTTRAQEDWPQEEQAPSTPAAGTAAPNADALQSLREATDEGDAAVDPGLTAPFNGVAQEGPSPTPPAAVDPELTAPLDDVAQARPSPTPPAAVDPELTAPLDDVAQARPSPTPPAAVDPELTIPYDGVAQAGPSPTPPVGAAPKPKAAPKPPPPAPSSPFDGPGQSGTPASPAETPSGAEVEAFMPLREAIVLALRNNLDVEIARVDPAVAIESVRQAKGAFDPVISLGFEQSHDENPTATAFDVGQVGNDGMNTNAGFNGVLPLGLRYQSGYTMARSESGSRQSSLIREFRGAWVNQITMPLMRNLNMNDAKVRVVRSELGKKISDDVFAGRLTDIVASVENLYWDVAATRAQVNVGHKSLKTAQDLLEQTRVQQEVGVVSRVAVTQAEAGVAERELNLIQAENAAAAAKDRLLNALLAPSARVYQDRDVIPEVPTFQETKVDLEQAVANALQSRPDLAEARRRLESAELDRDLANNQLRPRLDLVANFTTRGLAGKSKLISQTFTGDNLNCSTANPAPARCSQPASAISGSGINTFGDFFGPDANQSYSVGAQFEVPLGNRAARGGATQRSIEVRRSRAQLRRAEQTAILDVRDAVRGLDSAAKAVGAAERRRAASAETLRAEQERLRLGDSTPFQVLQFEEDVATAERQVIDALRSHRNAITRVEQVQGHLLTARAIDVQDELDRLPSN